MPPPRSWSWASAGTRSTGDDDAPGRGPLRPGRRDRALADGGALGPRRLAGPADRKRSTRPWRPPTVTWQPRSCRVAERAQSGRPCRGGGRRRVTALHALRSHSPGLGRLGQAHDDRNVDGRGALPSGPPAAARRPPRPGCFVLAKPLAIGACAARPATLATPDPDMARVRVLAGVGGGLETAEHIRRAAVWLGYRPRGGTRPLRTRVFEPTESDQYACSRPYVVHLGLQD